MSGDAPTRREDHRAVAGLTIRPVLGLGEFGPDSDVAAEIVAAAPWLADGDVLVMTKIFSKTEGRMVAARPTPTSEMRCAASSSSRSRSVSSARRNRTLITENAYGLVQAAAGVDGSNVRTDRLAPLLPARPRRQRRAHPQDAP